MRTAAREVWLRPQRRSGIPPAPREVAAGFTPGHQNHSGAGGAAGQGTASILCSQRRAVGWERAVGALCLPLCQPSLMQEARGKRAHIAAAFFPTY